MKTIKIIVILVTLAFMLLTLGSCSSYQACPTYSTAMHQYKFVRANKPHPPVYLNF